MSFLEAWEAEKAFWAACTVDTYDLEELSQCWDAYRDMVKQERGDPWMHGDWVRSEDYRRDIAAANARVKELDAELAHARQIVGGQPCIHDANQCTPAERAVLDAVKDMMPFLPSPEELRADKRLMMPAKRALAELARRAAKERGER